MAELLRAVLNGGSKSHPEDFEAARSQLAAYVQARSRAYLLARFVRGWDGYDSPEERSLSVAGGVAARLLYPAETSGGSPHCPVLIRSIASVLQKRHRLSWSRRGADTPVLELALAICETIVADGQAGVDVRACEALVCIVYKRSFHRLIKQHEKERPEVARQRHALVRSLKYRGDLAIRKAPLGQVIYLKGRACEYAVDGEALRNAFYDFQDELSPQTILDSLGECLRRESASTKCGCYVYLADLIRDVLEARWLARRWETEDPRSTADEGQPWGGSYSDRLDRITDALWSPIRKTTNRYFDHLESLAGTEYPPDLREDIADLVLRRFRLAMERSTPRRRAPSNPEEAARLHRWAAHPDYPRLKRRIEYIHRRVRDEWRGDSDSGEGLTL
ncbi:MAG: hypothetical protein R3E12_04730 [Candidatus Eisenbacteria bacterium]